MAIDEQSGNSEENPLSHRRQWSNFSGDVKLEGKPKFHWIVKDFRVDIRPSEHYEELDEPERAKLFNSIVMDVLKRSEHPDGSRSAAVAITESGQLFVSNNTQRQHEFHKDCAEINMINVLTQLIGSEDKIARMYLTIGFKEGDIITPCGKCMDTLCDACVEGASITVLPINDKGNLPIKLNTEAKYPRDLAPGESWQTTIEHFMPYRALDLSPRARALAEEGLQALVDNPPQDRQLLPESDIERVLNSDPDTLPLREQHIQAMMKRALLNVVHGQIDGEQELEADSSLKNINRFMVSRIARAYHARPESGPDHPGEHEVKFIRCVVVRLADGSFHSITEIEGPHENAVPHAEVTDVAATRIDRQPITDIWVMEMNPEHIKEGIMFTSPKEGLERIYKRRPRPEHGAEDYNGVSVTDENVNVNYISFNDGRRTHDEVSEITRSFRMEEIFISQWKGSRQYQRDGTDAEIIRNGQAANGFGVR